LLFSVSKAKDACVWFSDNGERVGTYKGHSGAVWCCDVNRDSTHLMTGSADQSSKLWDVETGKEIRTQKCPVSVRWVSMAEGDRTFLNITDQVMGKDATIYVYDVSRPTPIREISVPGPSKFYQGHFGPLNKQIYALCDDSIHVYDVESARLSKQTKDNSKAVQSMSFSEDKSYFITASLDHTARLYDTKSLENLKVYESGRPVNAAAISPVRDHILLGGGQSAEQVTTTRLDTSQFKVKFFHKIFEEELAALPGHFGPVNTLAFAPDGSFASGGEDGFVRVHNIEDPTIFALGDDYDEEEEFY